MIAPWIIANSPPPPRQLLQRKLPSHGEEENCPLNIKFPLKIIAPLKQIPAKEYYEWTEQNYALSTSTIINKYCNLGVKSDLLPYNFCQILTKPYRTLLIRERLSLNASWFSYARTQKNAIFGKIDSEKNFIVNNENKTTPAWYLWEAPGEHT